MIVARRQNHSDHDHALTILLDTARSCNVQLNYEKFQYKKDEVNFFGGLIQQAVTSQLKARYLQLQPYQLQPARCKSNYLLV